MDWSTKWGMLFNVAKCKVMHVGRSNPNSDYVMGSSVLSGTREEKDLGVLTR
jgi:ribonucleases P/MRP protein subunit RPP40